MDLAYLAKLEEAASAPDSSFPTMLFDPMMNDFGDIYFRMDVEDYGQEAILVDPRFNTKNLNSIRPNAKRVDQYLEWIGLWDDYTAYLAEKYGSFEMAIELKEAGVITDHIPDSIVRRPRLKKGLARRLFMKEGFVPSFIPNSINPAEVQSAFAYMKELCDADYDAGIYDEEPDIDWAMNHKIPKSERELLARNTERYRKNLRVQILAGGSGVSGVYSNTDFIDNYYANMQRGAYSTTFSEDDSSMSLADGLAALEDQKYWHEGQKIAAEQGGTKYRYDGASIRKSTKEEEIRKKFSEYLRECFGVTLTGIMQSNGANKKAIKAQRAIDSELGYTEAYSKKKMKKLERHQRKIEKINQCDSQLAAVLLNNKLVLNNGTIRFEDMFGTEDHEW